MRDIIITTNYYQNNLGFTELSNYGDYLILFRDTIELHFFLFEKLDIKTNYGMVYIRTNDIDTLYKTFINNNTTIHPNGKLSNKVWGQKEFSLLDPDNNLITFGQPL